MQIYSSEILIIQYILHIYYNFYVFDCCNFGKHMDPENVLVHVCMYVCMYVCTYMCVCVFMRATRWRSWLRHCSTSQKVVGSIPGGVIGNFHCHNPSGSNKVLGSTQPLTEMSTRNIL